MSGLTLTKCDDDDLWDDFVKHSPQYNIFCQTKFLKASGANYELWWVFDNNMPCLGGILIKGDNGQPMHVPFPFSQYQGLLFSNKYSMMQQVHQQVNESFRLIDFLLAELEQLYSCISFCLHPNIEDVRSFSWFNYHEPEYGKFNIGVRYTGIIDLTHECDFEDYLKSIRKSKRYEYRKACRENLFVESSTDVDLLEKLYKQTFERQNISVDTLALKRLRNIVESALDEKYGELTVCRNEQGEALSAALFLYDDNCCYYLIGANNPNYRQTGSGVFIVLENIRVFQSKGYNYIDVCGLNSPSRGGFKSSLNARPRPYYVTTWESLNSKIREE
jgi:hypothetical protein